MKRVLSTKTLDEKTLDYARSLDLNVQCMDFIKITPIPFKLKNTSFDSIAFTSSNAVKSFLSNSDAKEFLNKKNIFALSGKTASTLGFQSITVADNAEELADKIIGNKCKSVLHPSGNIKLDILEKKLKQVNIKYNPLLVYETILNHIKSDKNYNAVLFYSPSGVKSFFSKNKWNSNTIACCIGETTAKAFKKKELNTTIIVPDSPSSQDMLKSIANYFKKHITEV